MKRRSKPSRYHIDKHDNRDYIIIADETKIPSSIDLSNYCQPTSQTKSCMTHVVLSALNTMVNLEMARDIREEKMYKQKIVPKKKSGARTVYDYINNNKVNYFSERFLFDIISKLKKPDAGYRDILKTIYNSHHLALDVEDKKQVAVYNIHEFARIEKSGKCGNINMEEKRKIVNDMKSVLASGVPIIGTIPFTKNTSKKKGNGSVKHKEKHRKYIKNHGVLFVGYNDCPMVGEKYFIFQNSLGKRWGTNGFGTITYEEFINYKIADLWVITDFSMEYIGDFEYRIRPSVNPMYYVQKNEKRYVLIEEE